MRPVTIFLDGEAEAMLEVVRTDGIKRGVGNRTDSEIVMSWLRVGTKAFVAQEEARAVGDHRLIAGLTVGELATALGIADLNATRIANEATRKAAVDALEIAQKALGNTRGIEAIGILSEFRTAEALRAWAAEAGAGLTGTRTLVVAIAWCDGTTYTASPATN